MEQESLDYFVGEIEGRIDVAQIVQSSSQFKQEFPKPGGFLDHLLGTFIVPHITPIFFEAYLAGRYKSCVASPRAMVGGCVGIGMLALESYLLYHYRDSLNPAISLFPLLTNLSSGVGLMIQKYSDRKFEGVMQQ